ncbi:MAG: hypothetical protein WBY75_20935 [Terracidiphilus sp.]
MRNRGILATLFVAASAVAMGQGDFTLTGIVPEAGSRTALDVNYTGAFPADSSAYLNKDAWRVWVRKPDGANPEELEVTVVEKIVSPNFTINKLRLSLSGDLPTGNAVGASAWHALFNPSKASGIEGLSFDSVVNAVIEPRGTTAAKPSCDNTPPDPTPYLCAPAQGAPADVSLSGSFLTGGGTKPIYTFELRGGLYKRGDVPDLLGFHPGVAGAVEINQLAQPPNNRTIIDPDSITAALAFQRLKPLQMRRAELYGLQFDEALPGGEFCRTDPSSNIVFRSSLLLGFSSISSAKHPSLYGTIYPVLALEAGKNLNKPNTIAMTAVDLSHYNAILRGVVGSDAVFAVASQDRSADVFSVSASYRVRLPAFDEPFVETLHQVTTVSMTTKARNWIQANVNYAPWKFKYLSLTAKYEYGELPPLFTLVNHQFTIGFTLQAVQSRNPGLVAAAQ